MVSFNFVFLFLSSDFFDLFTFCHVEGCVILLKKFRFKWIHKCPTKLRTLSSNYVQIRAAARGAGGWRLRGLQPPPPQFLTDQLTLSQPGGLIMPTTVLPAPPNFQTLRRACTCIINSQGIFEKFLLCTYYYLKKWNLSRHGRKNAKNVWKYAP